MPIPDQPTYWNEARMRTSFKAFSFSLTLSLPILTYIETLSIWLADSIFDLKDPINAF